MSKDQIDKAINDLLTSDGKGKRRKAQILQELCETTNPCVVRDKIQKLLSDKNFV